MELSPPQYLALGDFSINAIPEGYVEPRPDGNYDICVDKVFLFINDSFNFEGEEYLGRWELDDIMGDTLQPSLLTPGGIMLSNRDFREFSKHGYGRTFPVLSKLQELKFQPPVCREYQRVK